MVVDSDAPITQYEFHEAMNRIGRILIPHSEDLKAIRSDVADLKPDVADLKRDVAKIVTHLGIA